MRIFPTKKRLTFYACVLALGMLIGISSEKSHLSALPKPISESLTTERLLQLKRLDVADLQTFFSTPEPGLIFVYATWDDMSLREYHTLLPLMERMPSLALAVGDDPVPIAMLHASDEKALPFAPLVITRRQILSTRNFLQSRGCHINATLPYIALSDGNGNCIAQWQGYIDADSILITQKTLLSAPFTPQKNASMP